MSNITQENKLVGYRICNPDMKRNAYTYDNERIKGIAQEHFDKGEVFSVCKITTVYSTYPITNIEDLDAFMNMDLNTWVIRGQ
jgi:hypothetical protein